MGRICEGEGGQRRVRPEAGVVLKSAVRLLEQGRGLRVLRRAAVTSLSPHLEGPNSTAGPPLAGLEPDAPDAQTPSCSAAATPCSKTAWEGRPGCTSSSPSRPSFSKSLRPSFPAFDAHSLTPACHPEEELTMYHVENASETLLPPRKNDLERWGDAAGLGGGTRVETRGFPSGGDCPESKASSE